MKPSLHIAVIIALVLLYAFVACGVALGDDGTAVQTVQASGGISPEAVGIIIATALGTGGGAYAIGRAHTVKVTPQPLEVKESKDYATRDELDALEQRMEKDIEGINHRIDSLASPLAEIKGKIDVINQNQKEILSLLLKR